MKIQIITFIATVTLGVWAEELPQRYHITNVKIFNGWDDRLVEGDVIVEGNRIIEVSDEPLASIATANVKLIDGKGCVLSPGFVSPTFTEWMMDGIWPDDITPEQCADMIDYYVKLIGVDHVGIASDDMFTTEPTMDFVAKNASAYNDDGYMVDAFNKGATGCGELSKILAATTDVLWKRGYSDEDLAKIYGGNKMRVYQQIWEDVPPEQHEADKADRVMLREALKQRFESR